LVYGKIDIEMGFRHQYCPVKLKRYFRYRWKTKQKGGLTKAAPKLN